MNISSSSETVKVIVRCRPMNSREIAMKCKYQTLFIRIVINNLYHQYGTLKKIILLPDNEYPAVVLTTTAVIKLNAERCTCSLLNPNDYQSPSKTFTFDGVYDEASTTEQIYNEIAYPLIEGVLDGYNSTIFAYGQTGCGKSFSMQGIQEPDYQRGIIPRAFEHIFEAISLAEDYKYLVLASYLEIYNEEIRDLLGENTKRKLELKENPDLGVYVNDLSYHAVHNVLECQKLMEQGWRNRAIGATLMNADSSRSHSIFTISVEIMPISQTLVQRCASIKRGKLNLVDLAGSERQAKTGATGDRLKEATKINLSLSALGNVISALVDGKAKHIPYRDSKLTRLLQDSLGGNTKTLMVACLSPADNNYEETLSTLRYANRAKNICNQPHINEDPKDTMLREYQEEISKLRKLLECVDPSQKLLKNGEPVNFNTSNHNVTEIGRDWTQKYEQEMEKLRKRYEEEYISKCQVQADLLSLKEKYESEVAKLNEQTVQATTQNSGSNLDDQQKINAAQLEIIKRLQKLQASMVGGERVNDRELKEKRLKKKRAAEQRLNVLAKVLAKVEDEEGPNLVLKVYDDIQEELKAKTDLLRKYKQKVKVSEKEIEDIQYEFEIERTDYLETIRRQERQQKLLEQIINNVLPALSKECNYSNIEKIKEEAKWNEESQCWEIPALLNPRVKFPPTASDVNNLQSQKTAPAKLETTITGCALWSRQISTSSSESSVNTNSTVDDQKFQRCDLDNFAGTYFKPRRATELLMQAKENANKTTNGWKDVVQQYNRPQPAYRVTPDSGVSSSKSNHLTQAHSIDNPKSRIWVGQASPVTWMTGQSNVRVAREMLPKRSTKIDLLPLIRERRGSFKQF